MKTNITYIVVVAVTAVLTWYIVASLHSDYNNSSDSTKSAVITDTIIDTVIVYKNSYQPKHIIHDTTIIIKIDSTIDTNAIIQNYLTTRIVTDTLIHNKQATIILTDTITQNAIVSRNPQIRLYIPRITTLIKHSQPKYQMFAGMTVGGNVHRFSLGPSIAIQHKKQLLGLSYDLVNKEINLTWRHKLF